MEKSVLSMLSLAHRTDGWQPPVVKTTATEGRGIDELVETISRFHDFFRNSTAQADKQRDAARQRLMGLLEERLVGAAVQAVFPDGALRRIVDEIAERKRDPYSVVDEIIQRSKFERLT